MSLRVISSRDGAEAFPLYPPWQTSTITGSMSVSCQHPTLPVRLNLPLLARR